MWNLSMHEVYISYKKHQYSRMLHHLWNYIIVSKFVITIVPTDGLAPSTVCSGASADTLMTMFGSHINT